MSLPRWAGRYEQKAKRLIKRLHSLAKNKMLEEAFWIPSEKRELIRFDVVVKNPLNGDRRSYVVQCISPVPDTAVHEIDRNRDIERCAYDMAALLHKEGLRHCIDSVFSTTAPVGMDSRPLFSFEHDDGQLAKKFFDLLMDKMTSLDESAARRKYYDDFMLRRYM